MKLRLKKLASVFLGISALFTFQNCAPGLKMSEFESQSLSLESGMSALPDAPTLSFTVQPPSLSNLRNHTFTLALTVDKSAELKSVTCQLDNEAPVNCWGLSWVLTGLTDGDHVLKINAEDSLGQKAVGQIVTLRIDATAPVIAVSSQPAAVTGTTTANFVFGVSDALSGVKSIECATDAGAFAACLSPVNLATVTAGAHTLKIRATDVAGNLSPVQTIAWTVNLAEPTLTISARPAAVTNSTSASFNFTGTSPVSPIATYECSIDGGAFATCTSPRSATGLAPGPHSFGLRAKTQAGATSSPVVANWIIDTAAPTLPIITANVAAISRLQTASFSFVASDVGSSVAFYQCSIDGSAFATCTSPYSAANLIEASHTFNVRAVDHAGNQSAVATKTWLVDTSVTLVLTGNPDAVTTETSAIFSFNASDSASGIDTVTCQLDSQAAAACTSPKNFSGLSVSAHTLRIIATDKAGNSKTVTYSWTVSPAAATVDGVALYAANCVGCHGPLTNSAVSGRSATQISNAIGNQSQMAGLKFLTSVQVSAIAKALESMTSTPSTGTVASVAPNAKIVDQCTSATVRGFSRQSNRKLTKAELLNTVKDLFPDYYSVSILQKYLDFTYFTYAQQQPMQRAINNYPDEYTNPATSGEVFDQVHTGEQLQAWLDFTDAFAQDIVKNNLFNNYSNNCLGSGNTDACIQDFIRRFGRKALRRPIPDDEVARYLSLKSSDGKATAAVIIAAMLISPDFMFHMEAGAADGTGRLRLTDYEVANRISYSVTAAPPDTSLAAAAETGQLKTVAQVEAHTMRLLVTNRAKANVQAFFANWLRLDTIKSPSVLWTQAKLVNAPYYTSANLNEQFRAEAMDYISYVIWTKKGSFQDLMSLPVSFPRQPAMADILGTSFDATGATPQSTPNNPGLLTRPALLASSGLAPNTIMRGVMLKRRILCDDIPSPDFTTVATRVTQLGELDPYSMPNHEIVRQTTNSVTCMACHASINPLGNLFESYSPMGRKQTQQEVPLSKWDFPSKGLPYPNTPEKAEAAIYKTFALPAAQTGLTIEAGLPTTFNNSDEFISAVAKSDKARACMTVRLFRHLERRSETASDACALGETQALMKQNLPLLTVFTRAIANEDIFWRKPK